MLKGMEICLSLKNGSFGGTQHSRGDEVYSHPQIPRVGDVWTMKAPHSGGAVQAEMWQRGESSTTLSSAGLFMLRFCLDQHAMEVCMLGSWACISPHSGGKRPGRRIASGTCLNNVAGNAWPTAQPRQDPAEKSCAPVLPQAAELCSTQSQPGFSTQGAE